MEMVGHTSIIYSVHAHVSGLIVSGSEDGSVKIWKDGVCVQSIEHPGCVWDAKFMENGDIVSACSDGVVRIWTTNKDMGQGDSQALMTRREGKEPMEEEDADVDKADYEDYETETDDEAVAIPKNVVDDGKIPKKKQIWTTQATLILLDNFRQELLQGKKPRQKLSLRGWTEVAGRVSELLKTTKTVTQCKDHTHFLKRAYREEISLEKSNWEFFERMDSLVKEGLVTKFFKERELVKVPKGNKRKRDESDQGQSTSVQTETQPQSDISQSDIAVLEDLVYTIIPQAHPTQMKTVLTALAEAQPYEMSLVLKDILAQGKHNQLMDLLNHILEVAQSKLQQGKQKVGRKGKEKEKENEKEKEKELEEKGKGFQGKGKAERKGEKMELEEKEKEKGRGRGKADKKGNEKGRGRGKSKAAKRRIRLALKDLGVKQEDFTYLDGLTPKDYLNQLRDLVVMMAGRVDDHDLVAPTPIKSTEDLIPCDNMSMSQMVELGIKEVGGTLRCAHCGRIQMAKVDWREGFVCLASNLIGKMFKVGMKPPSNLSFKVVCSSCFKESVPCPSPDKGWDFLFLAFTYTVGLCPREAIMGYLQEKQIEIPSEASQDILFLTFYLAILTQLDPTIDVWNYLRCSVAGAVSNGENA